MIHEFTSPDHPEANGRKPKFGEAQYPLTFPCDNGDFVRIRMGQEGFETLTQLLFDMLSERPSYSDGSVPDLPPDDA